MATAGQTLDEAYRDRPRPYPTTLSNGPAYQLAQVSNKFVIRGRPHSSKRLLVSRIKAVTTLMNDYRNDMLALCTPSAMMAEDGAEETVMGSANMG